MINLNSLQIVTIQCSKKKEYKHDPTLLPESVFVLVFKGRKIKTLETTFRRVTKVNYSLADSYW